MFSRQTMGHVIKHVDLHVPVSKSPLIPICFLHALKLDACTRMPLKLLYTCLYYTLTSCFFLLAMNDVAAWRGRAWDVRLSVINSISL